MHLWVKLWAGEMMRRQDVEDLKVIVVHSIDDFARLVRNSSVIASNTARGAFGVSERGGELVFLQLSANTSLADVLQYGHPLKVENDEPLSVALARVVGEAYSFDHEHHAYFDGQYLTVIYGPSHSEYDNSVSFDVSNGALVVDRVLSEAGLAIERVYSDTFSVRFSPGYRFEITIEGDVVRVAVRGHSILFVIGG